MWYNVESELEIGGSPGRLFGMSKAEGSIGVRIMEDKECQDASSPKKRQTYYIHTELMEKVKGWEEVKIWNQESGNV